MERTYKPSINMWSLDTDADHILHRIGSDDYTPIRHTMVKDPEQWEEIAVADMPPYTQFEYEAKVEELIRERYTVSQEFALINNVMANVTEKRQSEYAAYQDYREECKRRAKVIVSEQRSGVEDRAKTDEATYLDHELHSI